MYIIVAGCGRVGSKLADLFSHEGHDVVIIDKDKNSFRRLGTNFNGIAVEGVAFDEEVLHRAGIEDADAFAAVTNFDNTNLMTAEIVTNIYQVPNVTSRLYNPDKELTFFKMGIDYVCSTTMMADRIIEKLFQGKDAIVQYQRADLGIQLVEFEVGEKADGRPSGDLDYEIYSKLIKLVRNNRDVSFDSATLLRTGDHVVLTMRKEGWNSIRACLGIPGDNSCPANIIPVSEDPMAITERGVKPKVLIGGCSQVGSHIAYLLSMEGFRVTLIDKDPSLFNRLPRNYQGELLEGMVYDEETLIKAGIEEADAFTAVTKFDNTNLMASEVAKHVFGVPNVLARLFNPDKEETFQALDLNYVCGTRMMARELLERILCPLVRTQGSCVNNMFDLVEFECPEYWWGKKVRSASEKARVAFAYVARRNTGFMPDDKLILSNGDTIGALGTPEDLQKLEWYLKKNS